MPIALLLLVFFHTSLGIFICRWSSWSSWSSFSFVGDDDHHHDCSSSHWTPLSLSQSLVHLMSIYPCSWFGLFSFNMMMMMIIIILIICSGLTTGMPLLPSYSLLSEVRQFLDCNWAKFTSKFFTEKWAKNWVKGPIIHQIRTKHPWATVNIHQISPMSYCRNHPISPMSFCRNPLSP